MAAFLYFQNQYNRLTAVEKLFTVQRLNYFLLNEYQALEKRDTLNTALIEHIRINHLLWDQQWWIKMREISKASLFYKLVRNYL